MYHFFWTTPSHLTEQRKQEHLPLSEKALAVLQSVKALTNQKSAFVFPGRPEGEPIKEIKIFGKEF